jgi:gluconokinase
MIILLMGVSGAGKTTVGRLLARELGWQFADADDFHSPANIAKMARGEPLTDADREPWLASLTATIRKWRDASQDAVLACSALKEKYRETLMAGADVKLVYLRGSFDLIEARLSERHGHYMRPQMLQSQFTALEEPTDAIVVDVDGTPAEIVDGVLARLQLHPK